jgi:cytochrome c oxidase cbb3-type subunit III
MIPLINVSVPIQLRLLVMVLLVAPAAPSLAAHDGARLFARHCAACHGSNGHGGVGVPLALPDLLSTVSDDYLQKTIRLGRPGRVMPAFRQLSDAEVKSIVAHVRSWATTPPLPEPKVGKGRIARGEQQFATYCIGCHGANGEGGHGTGVTFSRPRDLPVLAPALNNPGFLAAASDAMIKATIMRGRQDTPMPNFLNWGLSEKDIDDIVAFVRSFENRPRAESSRILESESPVLMRTSPHSVSTTVERLKAAVASVNMRLIRAVPADEGFVDEKKANQSRMIVDACDFNFVNKALGVDPRVGLFLPCRITVTEHQGKVLVMSINPRRLSAVFNNSELNQLCEQMYRIYNSILDEAVM